MLSFEHKFIFFENQKCASSSICSYLLNFIDVEEEKRLAPTSLSDIVSRHQYIYDKHVKNEREILLWRDGHWSPRKYRSVFKKRLADDPYKCFGDVRNSWDRVASAYFHLKTIPEEGEFTIVGQMQRKVKKFKDFNEFCSNINCDPLFQKGHFSPQLNFYKAGIVPTFFIHLDSITTEIPFFMRRLTGRFVEWDGSYLNKSERPNKDYRKLYSSSSKKIIKEKYSSDIEAFGFDF